MATFNQDNQNVEVQINAGELKESSIPISAIEELIKKHSLISDGYGGVLKIVEIEDLQTLIDENKSD